MFDWWRRRRTLKTHAILWHQHLMALARTPEIYQKKWVADDFDGRQNMVALVATVLFRKFRQFDETGERMADAVYKEIFSGFDHALREEGVGDASIARRMRKIGEHFFGLAQAMDQALKGTSAQAELERVIVRNVQTDAELASALAAWLIQLDQQINLTTLAPPVDSAA